MAVGDALHATGNVSSQDGKTWPPELTYGAGQHLGYKTPIFLHWVYGE